MKCNGNMRSTGGDGIWIISEGSFTDSNLPEVETETVTVPVKEYRISELARYLLSPKPVRVEKRLVGCKVYFCGSRFSGMKERLEMMLPRRMRHLAASTDDRSEVFISHLEKRTQDLKDPDLELHFRRIEDLLRPYDSTVKRLLKLDLSRISDVMGICEDLDGSRSPLNLQGNSADKIHYVIDHLSGKVGVILKFEAYSG